MSNKLSEISKDALSIVIGGQGATPPPGMAGGRWSGAPNPMGGGAAPGMGIRDTMQGGAVAPGGAPTGGLDTNPGGGGGGGGGPDRFGGGRSQQLLQ